MQLQVTAVGNYSLPLHIENLSVVYRGCHPTVCMGCGSETSAGLKTALLSVRFQGHPISCDTSDFVTSCYNTVPGRLNILFSFLTY